MTPPTFNGGDTPDCILCVIRLDRTSITNSVFNFQIKVKQIRSSTFRSRSKGTASHLGLSAADMESQFIRVTFTLNVDRNFALKI